MLESQDGVANQQERLISQSEFAKEIGKTRQYVNKLVKKGTIPAHGAKKQINPDEAKLAMQGNADPARAMTVDGGSDQQTASTLPSKPLLDETTQTFRDAKTQREQANAEIAQLQLQKLQESLINKTDVQRSIYDLFRKLRDQLLDFPSQCADEIVALGTEREVAIALEEKVTNILDDFSQKVAKAEE